MVSSQPLHLDTFVQGNVDTIHIRKCVFFFFFSGSVGDAISVINPDVYVSDDGGYTWIKALDGPHHYAILDSGGLLVAVEHNPNQPISRIK